MGEVASAIRPGRTRSKAEEAFAFQCKALGLTPVREFSFHPTRKWRFDFAFPLAKVAVEIDGAVWSGGRHTRGSGYVADAEKFNEALVLGWQVIRVVPQHVAGGEALSWTLKLLEKAAA